MPVRKLKPIEDRDPYARMVMEAWDNMTQTPKIFYCIRFDICDEQCEACFETGNLAAAKKQFPGYEPPEDYDRDDSPYCGCGAICTGLEASERCEACGKII